MSISSKKGLAIFALEIAFWLPFSAVPILVRWTTSQPVWLIEPIVCFYVSLVICFLSSFFRKFQPLFRLLCFVVFGIGSLIATGIALFQLNVANPEIMLSVINTNPAESREFLSFAFKTSDYLIAACILIPALALIIQARYNFFWKPPKNTGWGLLALLVIQVAVKYTTIEAYDWRRRIEVFRAEFPSKTYEVGWFVPGKPYLQLAQAFKLRSAIAQTAAQREPMSGVRAAPSTDKRTYVVVIGESLSKAHMGLYGYKRPTTPHLSELASAGDLFVFSNAVTAHASTGLALFDTLTWVSSSENKRRTVIDLFNAAGFTTYWLSNQPSVGVFDNTFTLMTRSAHSRFWLNEEKKVSAAKRSEDVEVFKNERGGWAYPLNERKRSTFDDGLIPVLQDVVAHDQTDKVIFLHLMGSHAVYRARFPKEAEFFSGDPPAEQCHSETEKQIINDYDNSVRFNDLVIKQVIDAVKNLGGETFVLYLSDHGDEVFEFRKFFSHADALLSPYMAEIPLVLWLSDRYKQNHPDFVSGLLSSTDQPYGSSNFVYSLADLARLEFPGMDSARSVFSKNFKPSLRITSERDYDEFRSKWRPDAMHAAGLPLLQCK